jgi:tetratricopeptide (TPR) repeat protein
MRNVAHAILVFLATAAGLPGCTDPDVRRGDLALAHGRYEEAVAAYEQARARLPDDPAPAKGVVAAHRAEAEALMDQGRCDDARTHLAAAEALSAPVLTDHQALARCLDARHAPPEAQADELRRLVTLGDTRASVLRALMTQELDQGRDADAVGHAAMLEQRAQLSTDERRRLVDALLRLGRDGDALPHIERILAADPMDPLLRLKRAELLATHGRAGDARAAYVDLTRDFPQNPVVFLRLADFLRRSGDEAGAAEAQLTADRLRGVTPPPTRTLRPLKRSRR